jgi:Bacterial capsule synthesis protein PGA_cap
MQQVDYSKYNPVITITLKGKILVGIVRFYYRILQWFGKDQWESVVPSHHEDPLKMTFAEKRYLGHKYYFKGLIRPEEGSNLEEYFHNQHFRLDIPAGFSLVESITLNAGGDLIPYTCIQADVCKNIWRHTGDFFFNADIVFANLETPADYSKPSSAAPEVMLHDMYFNADAAMMKIFNGNDQYKGFDVVSVANNHSLDAGTKGLLNTLQLLKQKNIAYCGAAMKQEELHDFPIIDRKGIKIAFLSATFSFNKEVLPKGSEWLSNHIELNQPWPDISLLIQQADIARERGADIIVAALHMGCAYQAYPSMHSVNNIHAICDQAGIDIIIAGHPHHAQPMELYVSPATSKQHFIVYSLGDFIAYDIFKWGHLSLLLKLEISKGTLNGQSFTCITGIQIKPVYMHAIIKNGTITSLELLDYLALRKNPSNYPFCKKDMQKFNEVSDFFERFVLQPHQQHLLV